MIEGEPLLLARSLVAIQQVHLARWVETGMDMPAAEVAARLRRTFRAMFCRGASDRPSHPAGETMMSPLSREPVGSDRSRS